MDTRVDFRSGNRTPVSTRFIVSYQQNPSAEHLWDFKGIEVPRPKLTYAWGEKTEVTGIINTERKAIVFTTIGGIAIEPEYDQEYTLSPVTPPDSEEA